MSAERWNVEGYYLQGVRSLPASPWAQPHSLSFSSITFRVTSSSTQADILMNTDISDPFNIQEHQAEALAYIRKESLDIFNRVHSISEDVSFVNEVHKVYPDLPILPNLRCGAWYTEPAICLNEPAYFKSTDGHFGNWMFNLRRPNLHLLPHIQENHGMIIVDSTRSGKRIPDALSKTLPIWCAVINRAIARSYPQASENSAPILDDASLPATPPISAWDTNLYTPPGAVSAQEHQQIELRLDEWADSLVKSSYVIPRLQYPLRPLWITPATSSFPIIPTNTGSLDEKKRKVSFLPIICVSASKHLPLERRTGGFVYVQGSGDDHELWGMGLTPKIFWNHRDEILAVSRAELPEFVASLVSTEADKPETLDGMTGIVRISNRILLCSMAGLSDNSSPLMYHQSVAYLVITTKSTRPDLSSLKLNPVLQIETSEGKRGQIDFLQKVLPQSMRFVKSHLSAGSYVCIACDTGKDLSVGVALAVLQKFFDDDGVVDTKGEEEGRIVADKRSIRTRLEWIISSRPQANPSRTTLKRVNEFLLSSAAFRMSSS